MQQKFFIVLIALGLVTLSTAQWQITGYLTTETEPVEVDSVYFFYGSVGTWFPTPGWAANPGETNQFQFPEFPGWPAVIKYSGSVAGMPTSDSIYRPASDSWYSFPPPFDLVKIKFLGQTGIEEITGAIAFPALLNNLLADTRIEILNASGMVVRSRPLTPGVYFFRSKEQPNIVRRFLVIH